VCGQDPYLQSGWGTSLPMTHRRIAPETYWELRRAALSVRAFFLNYYSGEQKTQRFRDLYTLAEMVDIIVHRAYTASGLEEVVHALATDDSLEHALSRLGAEITLIRTGDYSAFRDLCSCEPPGQAEVLPSWSLDGARDRSKQLRLQRARNTSGGGRAATGDEEEDDAAPGAPRRRKRPPPGAVRARLPQEGRGHGRLLRRRPAAAEVALAGEAAARGVRICDALAPGRALTPGPARLRRSRCWRNPRGQGCLTFRAQR